MSIFILRLLFLHKFSIDLIAPQTIQQITSRIDIIDIVSDFVKLKKRGANYLGLCPFHNERTPSFTVSPSKEIYKCFGCGRSGNSITFLMEHEKYSYVEALKWLAQRYNVTIEETEATDEIKELQQTAESLYAINNFAQKFFSEQLLNSTEGNDNALSYLEERGFTKDTIEKFKLGYNPRAGNAFALSALQQQFNKELLLKTGIVVNRNDELNDNYRGRIIFPIHHYSGKIAGFGARVIGKAEKAPKYINTPENEIYSKSKILYGAYFARHAIDKADECLLVEGYTDVISLHQAGIENVVASSGTSLTTDQLQLIKRYTNNLTIIYDGDAAGVKAAMRGLNMALEESLNVRLVLISGDEDPDSYIKKYGAAAFGEYIKNNKKDFILFQLEVLLKEAGSDVTKKNEAVNQVAESLSRIIKPEDFVKKQEYIKQSAALLNIDEGGLVTLVNKYTRGKISVDAKKEATKELIADKDETQETEPSLLLERDEMQERNLLRVLLEFGINDWAENQRTADYIFEELEPYHIDNEDMNFLLEVYRNQYNKNLEPTAKTLLYYEDERVRSLVVQVTMFPFELSQRWDEKLENIQVVNKDTSRSDVITSLNYFKLHKIKRMFIENQQDMQNTQNYNDQLRLIEVHKQLKIIETEITNQLGAVIVK